jgi:cytochrome c553
MRPGFSLLLSALSLAASLPTAAAGADTSVPSDAGLEFFEKNVRPVLVRHCYACHSAEAKKVKGGLRLDSRDGLLKGGDSGPAVVPGKPEESRLIKAVRYADDELKMPPKEQLPAAVLADLEAWVKMGAPDPREKAGPQAGASSWEQVLRDRRRWWSLQPVRQPALPAVQDPAWSEHPVDRFLLARLEQAGLTPAGPAEKRTLIRRLSLVLTGLPPAVEEVDAFLRDEAPAAYERLVDRLLASPHFGERWARHWMDVVRFTETHGNEWNYEVHHAWRYRDYLIRAFNDDVPYDRLVREHLAGDLLPPRWDRAGRFNESPIGTAFYRFGEVGHDDCIEFRSIGFDLLDGQLDTLTKVFQATTVACARCHDHKLDAVSMKDYYALLGILRSSRLVSHTTDAPAVNEAPLQRLRDVKAPIRQELAGQWLRESRDVGKYLLAAQAVRDKRPDAGGLAKGLDPKRLESWVAALKAEKPALEDLFSPWQALHPAAKEDAPSFAVAWKQQSERYVKENRERAAFNAGNFVSFGDFRFQGLDGWQATGQGLRDGPSVSGDFAPATESGGAVSAIFPAGLFTHRLSEKLNGALRSPVLRKGKKHISFQVLGGRTAVVRLVTNNCQLNYKNYRVVKTPEPAWVKFDIPDDVEDLRVYAELMTKFDNPKFPDQLGKLGGDENMQVRWETAAADPRSFFGVTRVVLHDVPDSPRDELTHMRPLFTGPQPKTEADLAARYAAVVEAAVQAWAVGWATDDDVRWLDGLVRRGLLGNARQATPQLEALVAQYRATEQQLELPRVVPGLGDFDAGFDQPVLVRGDCRKPGEVVPRRYLEVLANPQTPFTSRGSGRLELAERIASPDNPLTARVLVNRVWHHLFGTGLVRTTDDFGHVGELPSHPELLDYLAARFVEDGWSVKRLIRSLVLTRAFQTASRASAAGKEIDPQNRLLHHYPARRLEAEAIRDAILAASGRLDRTLYGPSIQPYRDKENKDRRLFPGPLDGQGRRSLYIKANLMEGPRFLSAFNFPGGKVVQGRRDVTNVPAQALALLNDPFVHQQAAFWADRLVARPDATVAARMDYLFQVALGRSPELDELARFEEAVAQLADLHGIPSDALLKSSEVWKDVAHTVFNLKEFIYVP